MTKHNKVMLSLATIAILSGTSVVAEELKVENDKLQLGTTKIPITNGVANVTSTDTTIEVTSEISNPVGKDKMTNLNISASGADFTMSSSSSIGSTQNDTTDGYGFSIDTKSTKLNDNSQLNVNAESKITTKDGTTLDGNSKINIANGKNLTVSGGLTSSGSSTISIGSGSTLSVSGALNATEGTGTISLGGGTLTANGKATLNSTKLELDNGGTLNFNGGSGENASTISGAVSSTNGKALNINLSSGTELKFSDKLTLNNRSAESLDKISLGGGSLSVGILDADATNFLGAGTINFTDAAAAQTDTTGSKITNDFTIGSGTAINLGKNVYLTLGGVGNTVTTRGSKITFAHSTSTLNVSNLSANASDFDMSKGGKLIFAADSKSSISGNAALGEGASYTFSAAGTLDLDSLALTKTGNIEFASKDSVLNLKNGMSAEDASQNINISKGGTINFNGGSSMINGTLTTTASQDTLLNVNNASVGFEGLTLTDDKSILTLNGGTINMGALTTNNDANLDLKSGTLNFMQTSKDKEAGKLTESSIGSDLDLTKIGATLTFNTGSLVKLTGAGSSLTAKTLHLNGGQINLKKLVASTSESSDTLTLQFVGASASVKGDLSNTTAFTLGTDDKGNHFIGKDNTEEVKISQNSTLTLNSGTISTGKLTTEATGGKLIFGGGSLNVSENGELTIADTSKNLEFKDGVGGVLTLKGDGTNGATATITTGNLDLSKSSVGINIEKGAKLTTTAASKITGADNVIQLGSYALIGINGDITTVKDGAFKAYEMGALTLGKDTTLSIRTQSDESGALKEIESGKLTATDGATLAFGTGSVKLTGEMTNAGKLNNMGFADNVTLAKDAVLEFNSGSVNVKGLLNAADTATLKVSNSTANLNGNLGDKMTKIELDNGALIVKGDYTGTSIDVSHIQRNAGGISSVMNIDGTADIKTSKFAIVPLVETGATSYQVLSTTKGLTTDTLNDASGTTGEFRTRNSLNSILSKYGLSVADDKKGKVTAADKVIDVADSSVEATLRKDDKNLYLERTIDTSSLSAVKQASLQGDIDALTEMDKTANGIVSEANALQSVIDDLKARKTAAASQSNAELAAELGGGDSDILLSAFGNSSNGAIDSNTKNAVAVDIMKNGGNGIVKDIKDGASSSSNMASSTSSVVNVMNLSNDMAISGRIAQANNPFANYASYDELLYAALEGDMPLYYANNGYMNGFWANAVGGLNKIEDEGGILMGLSVGFDRQLENTLLGFYLSYALAHLNDKTVEQGSDNIQVGVYASFNQRDIEVNVKAYGQTSITDLTAKRGGGEAEASFIRQYAGISANIGKIFNFNQNSTFIKPFIGENYYYAHTPAYDESRDSVTALSVSSANNHALSFDIGVDVRQYWSENSFVYITPSVERYVVNSGGDYTAGFIGSDTTFTIEGKSKTKTYGQVLLGGNIALGDKFNINVGLGAKKILGGQIERDNGDKVDELYISGNLGVKYRF